MIKKNKAILIFGPTASGKTRLAIEIAKKFNGEIINVDSRQVYKDIPIITAMPSEQEFAEAKHHLFNFLQLDAKFSVAEYLKLAKEVADDIISRGKIPVFVGGTGLYLKVLEYGISQIPNIDEALFNQLNAENVDDLYNRLVELDNNSAKTIKPKDKQRIVRALGIFQQTGKSLSQWQEQPNEGALDLDFIHLAINPNREEMYERINTRAEKMLEIGLVDEIKGILGKYQENRLNSLTSIGVDIFISAINNKISMDNAIVKFAQKQRNYAKRQITWLRHQYKTDFTHFNIKDTFEFISSKLK